MMIKELIDRCIAIKQGNKELALFYIPDEPDGGGSNTWRAEIGNTSEWVLLGEAGGEYEGSGETAADALLALIAAIEAGQGAK